MGRHQRIAQRTTKPTPQNKIYLGTQLKRITILDILIKNVNGQIITDIYHKQSDIQRYLHFRSHRPKNCIKSIPYTLVRKIYTIIPDKNLKKNTPQRTTLNPTPTTLIDKGLELAEKIPQGELRNPKNTTTKNP